MAVPTATFTSVGRSRSQDLGRPSIGRAPPEIDSLKLSDRNARTQSTKQIATIAASIKAFGVNNPVLIDKSGSIIAGRVEAANPLGLETVHEKLCVLAKPYTKILRCRVERLTLSVVVALVMFQWLASKTSKIRRRSAAQFASRRVTSSARS